MWESVRGNIIWFWERWWYFDFNYICLVFEINVCCVFYFFLGIFIFWLWWRSKSVSKIFLFFEFEGDDGVFVFLFDYMIYGYKFLYLIVVLGVCGKIVVLNIFEFFVLCYFCFRVCGLFYYVFWSIYLVV